MSSHGALITTVYEATTRACVANILSSYYKKDAISISQIAQKYMKGYQDLRDFTADWRRLFQNARMFNEPGSDIYQYTDELQEVYEAQLKDSAHRHRVSESEEL
ncbi:hypothetical protein PM082_018413 [Marasmius tenuissimus]|nr:hypothetical protein PM082_018413 [Marasmius tenuissimus]